MIIGKREVVITADYSQLDDLIQSQFGIENYECLAAEEWGDGEEHRFDLTRVGEPGKFDADDIGKAKRGDYQWKTRTLLEDLVRREILEPAIYIIRVSY